MVLTKEEAIDCCVEKGKKFMKLFDDLYSKLYKINFNATTIMMDKLYQYVNSVKINSEGNPITHNQLRDWFFDANAKDEFFINNYRELDFYDKFVNMLLSGEYENTASIYEVLLNNRGQMLYVK